MAIRIPFIEAPSFTEELNIEERTYKFQFVFNSRSEAWSLSIFDPRSNPIVEGIRLVLNYELIRIHNYLPIPPGHLFVVDTDATNEAPIAFEDFTNQRALQLVYFTEAEFVPVS